MDTKLANLLKSLYCASVLSFFFPIKLHKGLAFPTVRLRRLIHYGDVFGQMLSVRRGASRAAEATHEILDSASPSNQNVFFPCGVLQGQAEGQPGRVDPDGHADDWVTC